MSDLWDMGLVLRPVVREAASAFAAAAQTADADLAPLRCDVSLMSDDSAPADEIIAGEANRIEAAHLRRLALDASARLRCEYDADRFIPHPACILQHVNRSCTSIGIPPTPDELDSLLGFLDRL